MWLGDSVKDSTANENGKCHFDSVIAGIYSIKIYAAGYDTFIEPSVYIKPISNPEFFESFVVKFLSPEIDHHVKSAFEPQETITVFSSRK